MKKGPQHSHNGYYLLGAATGGAFVAAYFLGRINVFYGWTLFTIGAVILARTHYELDD